MAPRANVLISSNATTTDGPRRLDRRPAGLVASVRKGVFSQTHNGLAVVGRTVQLKPGEAVTISYDIRTGRGQQGTPALRVAPVTLGEIVPTSPSRCT